MLLSLILLVLLQLNPLHGATDWSAPRPLLDNHQDNGVHTVSANTQGETVVGFYNCLSKRLDFMGYDYTTGESQAVPLETYPCDADVSFFKLELDDTGNLFAAWVDEKSNSLKAARALFPAEGHRLNTWSDPLSISDAHTIRNITLKCDQLGNAFLIWEQDTGYDYQVKMTHYSREHAGWTQVVSLSSIGDNCHSTKIAIDRRGNGVVAWCFRPYTGRDQADQLRAVRIEGKKLRTFEIFSRAESQFSLQNPDIGMDPEGNVYLVWERSKKTGGEKIIQTFWIDANLKHKGNIRDIAREKAHAPFIQTIDHDPYVFWIAENASGNPSLHGESLKFLNSISYSIPLHMQSVKQCQLDRDPQGKMRLVYANDNHVHVAVLDDVWSDVRLTETPAREIDRLQVASDTLGNSLVTWTQDGQTYYATGDYLTPPGGLSITRIEKNFPAKTIIRAHLTWKLKNPSIVAYRIRRNRVVLDEVRVTEYMDRCCPKGELVYSVSSINDKGLESEPVEIFFQN